MESIQNGSSRLRSVIASPDTPVSNALRQLDEAGTGALLLCDDERRLQGLLTDGDVRRAFLRGVPFHIPCLEIATHDPIVGTPDMTAQDMLRLMQDFDVNHLPVVDGSGCVVDFALRHELAFESVAGPTAVIMAGGYGKRLHPLTENVPKPLLPVGDTPLMEIILGQLRKSGIRRVNVTTHHLAEMISDHFGDGSAYGVELNYVTETRPLGTVGGLRLMKNVHEPMLVINGDILTGVDFTRMLAYHREYHADMTIGVRKHSVQVRYGVVDCDGPHVRRIREKPEWEVLVNAGIYILEPRVARFIPADERFDMTDLLQKLLEAGRPVVSFPIFEYWMDIGTHSDYAKAQEFCAPKDLNSVADARV